MFEWLIVAQSCLLVASIVLACFASWNLRESQRWQRIGEEARKEQEELEAGWAKHRHSVEVQSDAPSP